MGHSSPWLRHGTETVLVPFAAQVSPQARLMAVRGRIVQEESRRWFTRLAGRVRSAQHPQQEQTFARFACAGGREHGFDPADAVFLGYSTVANLVSACWCIRDWCQAVLMRAMPVLDAPPYRRSFPPCRHLVLSGRRDATYGYAAPLAQQLRRAGARVGSYGGGLRPWVSDRTQRSSAAGWSRDGGGGASLMPRLRDTPRPRRKMPNWPAIAPSSKIARCLNSSDETGGHRVSLEARAHRQQTVGRGNAGLSRAGRRSHS